jgi:hypothetical protein
MRRGNIPSSSLQTEPQLQSAAPSYGNGAGKSPRLNLENANMMQIGHLAASIVGAAFFMTLALPASAQEGIPPATPGGWAVVNADGSLKAHSNVKNVKHPARGAYRVVFNQPVSGCAATATIGGSAKTVVPGYIVVRRNDNAVGVHTFAAATLLPTDFKFNLNLVCPAA